MSTVSTRALKDQLSSYLQRAEDGERIVVLRAGRPGAVASHWKTRSWSRESSVPREVPGLHAVVAPRGTLLSRLARFTGAADAFPLVVRAKLQDLHGYSIF